MGAIGKRCRRVGPGARAACDRTAEQARAVIDLDHAACFRGAGQRQRIVIGDVVARHPAVGRERGDGRPARGSGVSCWRSRRGRVDGDSQRR